jgi:hypothetical protein
MKIATRQQDCKRSQGLYMGNHDSNSSGTRSSVVLVELRGS